jgi:hypothetical protein
VTDRLHHALEHAMREMERQPEGPVLIVRAHLVVLIEAGKAVDDVDREASCEKAPCPSPTYCRVHGCQI